MAHIQAEHWIPVRIGRVFAFFSDPRNLPRLMPLDMQVRIEELRLVPPLAEAVVDNGAISGCESDSVPAASYVAGEGSEITISFRLLPFLPFRGRWTAKIVEFRPGRLFRDVQVAGPMTSWSHSHEFERQVRDGVEGTFIRDVVDYELPLGVLGRAAELLFARRMMHVTFQSRQRQVEQILL